MHASTPRRARRRNQLLAVLLLPLLLGLGAPAMANGSADPLSPTAAATAEPAGTPATATAVTSAATGATADPASAPATPGSTRAVPAGATESATSRAATASAADTQPTRTTDSRWPAEQPLPRLVTTDGPWDLSDLAGRTSLHHIHVDAGHLAWNEEAGTVDVQVIKGATPVPADTVIVRIGPEADTSGREISRVRIPASPRFRFLGEPGTIIWNAPEKWYQGWSPVWSGLGSGHDFPAEIDPDSLTLELTELRGPGWASVWNGDEGDAREFFSTRNPGHTRLTTRAGSHGHYSWSFEKPGRYTFVWRGLARTHDGREIVGPERTIVWLVGSDEDLGLPAGTWNQHYAITTPTEDQPVPGADTASEGGSADETPSAPTDPASGGTADGALPPNSDQPMEDEASAPDPGTYTCLPPGHYDLEVTNAESWRGLKGAPSVVLHGLVNGEERRFGVWEAVIPVPDSAMTPQRLTSTTRALSPLGQDGTRLWLAPQNQVAQVPWVGFTTQHADFSAIADDGLRLYAESFTGPGRMLTFTSDAFAGLSVYHDSRSEYSKYVFSEPTHTHLATAFNQPGLYDVSWKYAMRYDEPGWFPNEVATSLSVYYAVGNARIEQLCPGWLATHDVAAPSSGGSSSGSGTGAGDDAGSDNGSASDQGGSAGDDSGAGDDSDAAGSPESGHTPSGSEEEDGTSGEQDASHGAGAQDQQAPGTSGSGVAAASSDLTCKATVIERPASHSELARLRSGTIGAEAGAGGRVNQATTTLTFSVGPGASGNAVSGHFDLGPVVSNGTLAARVKDDRHQPATWRPGSALRFAVGDAGKVTAPASLGFLTTPGSPVWMIGTTQNPRVPWVGLNSQHPGLAGATTGTVTFHLDSVTGPGRVAIFESGLLGGGVGRVLASGAGSSFTLPARTHAHHNWVFSQPGTYTLTVRMSVTPTGRALGALTDVPAGQGRVWVTSRTDGSGRPIAREIVGRRADGSSCEIHLPDLLGSPSAGAFTAAYGGGAAGSLLDASGSGAGDEAGVAGAGGLSLLGADKASAGAARAAVEVGEASGVLERDWSTSSVLGALLAAALLQAAGTILVLALRRRSRLRSGAAA